MDAATELGRNPVSEHQIQPEYGDEQADAGSDGRTRLARPNSQARTGTGECYFPCSADHEQDWQPYPVDPYSAICDDHAHIHTYIQKNGKSLAPQTITQYTNFICVCFLLIHSGHQVRWTYQPGPHRRKVTQDFSSTFFLRCVH